MTDCASTGLSCLLPFAPRPSPHKHGNQADPTACSRCSVRPSLIRTTSIFLIRLTNCQSFHLVADSKRQSLTSRHVDCLAALGIWYREVCRVHCRVTRMAITLDPSKPPLATIGRALTLVQVIFYLPLTLDVGGPDAFLALSASLASYYWCLSSLRLLTRKTRLQWIGTLFASFQFLVVPSCLAICWAVYCPPEKNYFFVRWARSASGGGGLLANHGPTAGEGLLRSHDASVGGYHPATPPHLAAIMQAITPILKSRNTHPYLEGLFDFTSASILYLARKVPTWWGTLLRVSSPVFSLLEGSATLLVIQVLGTGCRYIIATSLATPSSSLADADDVPLKEGEDGKAGSKAARPTSRYRPLSFLASIGIRGAEAWQLFFLLASAIIYVISGWSLYLSFEGVAARGGGASLMMGVSVASVAWLTAIAFGLGKGNVIETSLIVSASLDQQALPHMSSTDPTNTFPSPLPCPH